MLSPAKLQVRGYALKAIAFGIWLASASSTKERLECLENLLLSAKTFVLKLPNAMQFIIPQMARVISWSVLAPFHRQSPVQTGMAFGVDITWVSREQLFPLRCNCTKGRWRRVKRSQNINKCVLKVPY